MDSSSNANRPIADPGASLVDDIFPGPAAHGRAPNGRPGAVGRPCRGRPGRGPQRGPRPRLPVMSPGVTMSEDIRHPDPATSPFDVFLHRRPDGEPYRCARQAMPELGYGQGRRMADVFASR